MLEPRPAAAAPSPITRTAICTDTANTPCPAIRDCRGCAVHRRARMRRVQPVSSSSPTRRPCTAPPHHPP